MLLVNEQALSSPERLAALQRTGLLGSPTEDRLDGFTRLAAQILGVPTVIISLVEEDSQYFKMPAATVRLLQVGIRSTRATARTSSKAANLWYSPMRGTSLNSPGEARGSGRTPEFRSSRRRGKSSERSARSTKNPAIGPVVISMF